MLTNMSTISFLDSFRHRSNFYFVFQAIVIFWDRLQIPLLLVSELSKFFPPEIISEDLRFLMILEVPEVN